MSAERERPHVIPTPAAVEQAAEDRALDAALQDAAREIADSLRREETQQRQQRLAITWIPMTVVALIAIIVGLSLPRSFRDSPTNLKPARTQVEEQTTRPQTPPSRPASHTLHLPRGFEWQVDLVDVGDGLFHLRSDKNLNCLGLYRLNGDHLEMYKPVDKRLTEFVWRKVGADSYVLIEQPPAAKTGANYLGATLKPNSPN